MFYDTFCKLCKQRNLTPSGAAAKIGFNRATISAWKRDRSTPNNVLLKKISDYFDVTTDYLLTGEEKEKPAVSGERVLEFDDFTYALYDESKELPPEKKQMLLEMARFMRQEMDKKDGK